MDFDDLLFNAVAMLKKDDEVRASYQNRFKYLLVDEFQDTNGVQNHLGDDARREASQPLRGR